jgi:hypothetical protein
MINFFIVADFKDEILTAMAIPSEQPWIATDV